MSDLAFNSLSRRQKAAAVVQLLIDSGERVELSALPESIQTALTDALGNLRRIEREALDQIITEFTQEVESIGLTAPGSRDGAIMALADHLSPPLAERLRRELASFRNGDHWPVITDLPEDTLVRLLNAESIEVGAVALSKLPASKAAATLAKLPGERARRITYAMSKTADIRPDAVRRIGAALAHDYGTPALRAFDKAPVQRLGAILNATKSETREDVLLGLEAEDQPFATDVRKAIFTFKDIAPRVKPTDIPNCIRSVDNEVLVTALAAALAGEAELVFSAEFILNSLSQRMAGQLREDAAERGRIKKDDAEAAMADVTRAIREMVEAGVIVLIDPDADVDEDTGPR